MTRNAKLLDDIEEFFCADEIFFRANFKANRTLKIRKGHLKGV